MNIFLIFQHVLVEKYEKYQYFLVEKYNLSGAMETIFYLYLEALELTRYRANKIQLFVCVEVLRPSQPSGVMSSVVSLPNHTFTGQA